MLEWLTLLGLAGYAEVLQTHGYDHLEYMVSDTVRPSIRLSVCPCASVCVQYYTLVHTYGTVSG